MATVTPGITWASGDVLNVTNMNLAANPAISNIVDADVSASAAIAHTKLANITAGRLLMGNASNVPTATAVTGDVTITSSGATSIATGAVTGAAGGGKLAASSINSQTTIADALASGDEFLVYDASAAALRKVAYSSIVPSGITIQTLQDTEAAATTVTSVIAANDTAPTSSSGTEILSQAITLSGASNNVLVSFNGWFTGSAPMYSAAVILRGSTVIQTAGSWNQSTDRGVFCAEILDAPGTVGPHTYSVRIGSNTGIITLNGSGGSRHYGGTSKATLTLQEIKA